MASPKKPAPRAVPKKRAARKTPVRSTKTVTAKKRVVTKKSVKKKVAARKKVSITPSETFSDRLKKLDTLQAKKGGSISLETKTPVPSTTRVSVPAIPSPFRFPIAVDSLVTQTARFGGIALVIFGAVFSMFHLSTLPQTMAALESVSHVAQTSGASSTPTNTTPPAQFSTPANPLSGNALINIGVDFAQSVKLMAYSQADGQTITLGNAIQKGPSLWEYNWDTTKVSNGIYNLSALIKNQYGSYTEQSWLPTEVINAPPTTAPATTTTSTNSTGTTTQTITTTNTTTQNSSSNQQPNVVVNSANLQLVQDDTAHELKVEVTGNNIAEARVYVALSGVTLAYVGKAYDRGDGVFRYVYDTFGLTPGTYEVKVLIKYLDAQNQTLGPKTFNIIAATQTQQSAPTSTVTTTTSNTTQPVTTNLQPPAKLTIANASNLQGVADVVVTVGHAQAVEVYAIAKQSLTASYIGTARQINNNTWVFRFDSVSKPNGDYGFYASIKNAYGAYQSPKFAVTIKNPIVTSPTSDTTVKTLSAVTDTVVAPLTTTAPIEDSEPETIENTTPTERTLTTTSDSVLTALRSEFKDIFERLAAALRVNDQAALAIVKEQLTDLRTRVIEKLSGEAERNLLADIDAAVEKAQAEVDRTNKIVAERTELQASVDSDRDGISDFDEVTLYHTDPKVADTDGDGYPDGAEILRGFDPLDAAAETVVTYESPKETGIIREDIVAVEDVVVSPKSDAKPISETFITGRGMPNSFVTLYIFSTPVVVTVRTEDDGSWVYRFDKELEDGEHEVYAGITDNAGRIVAKSNPLRFVKEAEAFTPVDVTTAGTITTGDNSSIVTEKVILIVLSVSVLAIGVVLIMLGMHMDASRRKYATLETAVPAV